MSYRLKLDRPLPAEIERIESEQASTALSELRKIERSRGDYEQFVRVADEAVHEARKSLKKARAVARLVRDEIGEDVYKRENASYRDAGRALSSLRDANVLSKTLDNVRSNFANDAFADESLEQAAVHIQAQLTARHQEEIARSFDDASAFDEAAALIESAQRRIASWPIRAVGFDALQGGIRRTYKRGRKRMQDAYAQPAPERFHEWRKRVKYHWYHIRILRPVWPSVLKKVGSETHSLANVLGDAHDLAVLEKAIASLPTSNGQGQHEALLSLLVRRRRELERTAQPLGERVFAESPDSFVKRIGEYWDAAVSAGETATAKASIPAEA